MRRSQSRYLIDKTPLLYFSKNGEGIYYVRQNTSKGSKKKTARGQKNRCPDKQDSG
jgi:hypothetical protein